jgi:predicted TIM-barrel fold metal-dependent hydrolase
VASAIAHGIFERYPDMRLVLVECGAAWLPALLWRLDADYKALRKETPWLKRLPSEYAREHVRVSTQPLEQPPDERHLWALLEAMSGREVLVFASDYPHWDFDDPTTIRLPEGWEDDVLDGNARRLYGLPAAQRQAEPAEIG